MAGIWRFITYIYSYEDGKKSINAGFAKIEVRGNECRMEIHLRGDNGYQGNGNLSLFLEQEGQIRNISVGEMKLQRGKSDFGTIIKADAVGGTTCKFTEMEGLIIIDEEGGLFVSRWKDGTPLEIRPENIKKWEPPKLVEENESEKKEIPEKIERSTGAKIQIKVEQAIKAEPPTKTELPTQPEVSDTDNPEIQVTEIPMRNIFPQYNWLDVWERLKATHPVFSLYMEKEITCVRIELKDLREFPKKYWYMGNNSFLLHGFFNYRYLIVGELEEKRWFIGVPGVYQHQERVMASIFGFPEFILQKRPEVAKEGQKPEPINQFGYWYHMLDE